MVANLLAARLTVLYGASGVGKTSLLAACVARRLRQEPNAEVIVFSSWTGDAAARRSEASEAAAGTAREVYLILDQFEEYFLYHAGEEGEGTLPDELGDLLRRGDIRANVLISVREDALARLDAFKACIPNMLANYLRLPHLDRAGGRAAIEGPLERFRALAGEAGQVTIEPELVEAVLDDTAAARVELGDGRVAGPADGPDGGGIEAPILQLVMERLWDAERDRSSQVLRLDTFRSLGGAGDRARAPGARAGRAAAGREGPARDRCSIISSHRPARRSRYATSDLAAVRGLEAASSSRCSRRSAASGSCGRSTARR